MVYKDKWYKIAETYAFPTKGSISLLLGDSSVIFYANSDFSSSVISLVNHSVVPEVTIEIRMQNEGAKRTVEFRFLSATFNEGLIAEISIITGANWIETVPTESVTTNVIALLGEVIGTGGSGAFDPNQFFYFDEETGTVVSRYNIASEKGVSAYGIGTVGSGGGGYSPISVIDDLLQNTVDLTKALSARQGYILSGKIGEKQDIIPANTYSPFLHTHDNYAGKAAFEAHITNTDIHLSEPQKQALASFMEMFEMDVVNDSIKAKKTIYSVAGVSAYGLGVAGGGGGGADVYNGLDSDSPVMALSALQGKVLKGLIDTHNHSGVYATPSYVDQQISALVASSPETLNTLNELAAALGNDPNFATTITNQIGTKEPGLGNPASDGMILSSSAGGIRSWVNRYVLPIATAAILGGVMIGTGLSATAQGVLSHSDFSIESGIGGSLGHVKASEKAAWNNHIADNSAHMSVDERNFFNKLKTYFVFAADNSSVHTTINFFSQYGVSAYGLGVAGGGGSLVNVIDNLSSTSITEALSANMGRYLNTLISGKSDTGHSHTWESITGKPVTFAPSAHYHDDRYYTETEVANFFSGSVAISGYNKSYWDTAYGWGNHAGLYLPISGGNLNGVLGLRNQGWINFFNSTNDHYISINYIDGTNQLDFYDRTLGRGADIRVRYIESLGLFINGSAVLHEGNYSSYALPLSGGTISGTSTLPLSINTTHATEVSIEFKLSGVAKAYVGYVSSLGAYLYNNASPYGMIGILDNTTPYYSPNGGTTKHTLIHAGNYSSYASPLNHSHSYFYNGNSFGGDCNALAEDYKLSFTSLIISSATNLFPISNNANAIISIATHPGGYNHQLGFSSNGNIYSRQFSLGTPLGWKVIWDSGNLTQNLNAGNLPYWSGTSLLNSGISYSSGNVYSNGRTFITDGTNYISIGQWDGVNNRIEGVNRPIYITSYTDGVKMGYAGNVDFTIDSSRNVNIAFDVKIGTNQRLGWDYGDGQMYNWITNLYGTYGGILYRSGAWTGNQDIVAHNFQGLTDGVWTPKMRIWTNGKVDIGFTNDGFQSYKFAVNGTSLFNDSAYFWNSNGGLLIRNHENNSVKLDSFWNDYSVKALSINSNGGSVVFGYTSDSRPGYGHYEFNSSIYLNGFLINSGNHYIRGAENKIYFDSLGIESSHSIGVVNNYDLRLFNGRGTGCRLDLNNNGYVDIIGELYLRAENQWRYFGNPAPSGGIRMGAGNASGTWVNAFDFTVAGNWVRSYLPFQAIDSITATSFIETSSYLKAESVKLGNWEFSKNGDSEIYIKLNGNTKARINSNGDLVAYGGLSAYGIPQV